ncbi:ThiF family adenylyltransferase [Mucilaginibacter celer]|uniref:ThiF family adenylyltransferase n=1 Tax=Mucilaginibacter celer TaxID=2305508 RepID=A0A494VZY3_9SPHI|nr:ThiF family adenylyltransferase [Mucilaginibacter celer]AYL96532.1 ThiF family adenylyltransferase [Mucilaginibacter celer]
MKKNSQKDKMELQFKISGYDHARLMGHLFCGDDKESVAVALCGRQRAGGRETLIVHELQIIPNEECFSREYDHLHWPTKIIHPFFLRVSRSDMAIVKIHSHPGGYNEFSETDNRSDNEFFQSVFGWSDTDGPHASAVMLPGGEYFGRFFFPDMSSYPIDRFTIVGETIKVGDLSPVDGNAAFALRTIQAFGQKTYSLLKRLRIAVIGCSGTGSPLIEQLARLGVGELVLVDPDRIEHKNLNRIVNATLDDAEKALYKVHVLKRAIETMGLETKVTVLPVNLYDNREGLELVASCDVVFGCMDSVDGRHLLNQLSAFYLIPYFDLGVKLEADGLGGISKICGSVHYLQPGVSSLITRGVYTIDDLRAAAQLRKNPEEYEALIKNAYIKNINVSSPAVISVNMMVASHAINEFLNRIHGYKAERPNNYAGSIIDLSENCIVNVDEESYPTDLYLRKKVGRGDMIPYLEMPDLP